RSGSRYRLNRWREAQLTRGVRITYRDLVKEWVRLNRPETEHRRVAYDCYVNFVSDFMAANPGTGMSAAIRAWKTLKKRAAPKNYRGYRARAKRLAPPPGCASSIAIFPRRRSNCTGWASKSSPPAASA